MCDLKLFHIKRIPDLELSKYQTGNINGIDGMLEMHNAFLRLWNRKGVMSEVSLHLFYVYNPQKAHGEKLDVFLGFRGPNKGLLNIKQMIDASNLLCQYEYEYIEEISKTNFLNFNYNKVSVLTKKELFIHAPKSENDDLTEYYTLSDIEIDERGRLYQMFSLMEKLNEPVMYRVDLYPMDMSERIRTIFESTLEDINRRKEKKRQMFSLKSSDYLDNIARKYEDYFEKIENTPHFITNIMMFGCYTNPHENDSLELLLDAAASENVISGNYEIHSFIDEEKWNGIESLYELHKPLESVDKRSIMGVGNKGVFIFSRKASMYHIRFMPVLWCLDEVLPFFRLPLLFENEEIQIKKETVMDMSEENHSFYIEVGLDTYKRKVGMELDELVKHIFISGVPGSGKTNAMLKILSELNKDKETRIPFLVFEPAKKEYRALFNTKEGDGVILISPHMNTLFPVRINPFEFPKGILLSIHIGNIMRVFCGSFQVEKIVYELLDSAIEQAYVNCGWEIDDVNDENHDTYPTLADVYELVERQLDKFNYDAEIRGNVTSFIKLRLGGLMKRDAGEIFNVKRSSWRPEEWLNKSVIIELEALAEQDKNFMVLLLCNMIHETLTAKPLERPYKDCKLRHVIVIEEAHNIIAPQSLQVGDNVDPKISATQFIVKMLAEVRALGEGIIIADQIPTAMAPEVLKNTVNKFALKLISGEDRAEIGQAMLASEMQMEHLVTYSRGQALFFKDKMQKPMEMIFAKWQEEDELFKSKVDQNLFDVLKTKDEYKEIWQQYFLEIYVSNLSLLIEKSSQMFEYLDLFKKSNENLDLSTDLSEERMKKARELNRRELKQNLASCEDLYIIMKQAESICRRYGEDIFEYTTEEFKNLFILLQNDKRIFKESMED